MHNYTEKKKISQKSFTIFTVFFIKQMQPSWAEETCLKTLIYIYIYIYIYVRVYILIYN